MTRPLLRPYFAPAMLALALLTALPARGQIEVNLANDITLATDALLMPLTAPYGRAINGVAFQTENLFTIGDYQYSSWYRAVGTNTEDLMFARRNLATDIVEVLDTGRNLVNGDSTGGEGSSAWDAHNVVSAGISTGDGRIHMSYDQHGSQLNYTRSNANAATGGMWDGTIFEAERASLNVGGSAINGITYPQFVSKPDGGLHMIYRTGGSGNGNNFFATYNATTGLWDTPHQFINGSNPINYDDDWGNLSDNRNGYLNGVNLDAAGNIHITWTWREEATGGSNHDIMYAYSEDGGNSWKNNAGTVVGTVGSPMDLNSPGIIVVPMDRGNTLMNQQTQTVDQDGRVHVVMWHKTDEAPPQTGFTAAPSAYFHYFRDPVTTAWTRLDLPTERAVGSRPDIAYDASGNLFVTYVSPGPGDSHPTNYYTDGDLIVAGATKASGFTDWSILYTDTRDFAGEPHIDQQRLLDDGIISVFLQENNDANLNRTMTPLHILEFSFAVNLKWIGDDTATWDNNTGTDWDTTGDAVGNAAFTSGSGVTFNDDAAAFNVNIANPVSPGAMLFSNTAGNEYTFTGAAISGNGSLTVDGGGRVTLANEGNSYSGDTSITSGTLALAGAATISASPNINVAAAGTLDVTATNSGSFTLDNQSLTIDGDVLGDVIATNSTTVHVNSSNSLEGDLTVQGGSLAAGAGRVAGSLVAQGGTVRIGGAGLPSVPSPATVLIDDFNSAGLSEYTRTIVNDGDVATTNVSFSDATGELIASYAGDPTHEQVVFLRDDVTLAVGQSLVVDVAMSPTGLEMDFGLAVSETATPTAASGGDTDTRNTFDWTSVSVRPSQNNIRVNESDNGSVNTTAGTISSVSESTITALYITRTSATQFVVGYTDDGLVNHDATIVTFAGSNIGTALGFYADVRANGSLGEFDNLRIVDFNSLAYAGETLTVDGNYMQDAASTLSLDIFSPAIVDKLDVLGNLQAAGTLEVSLQAGAPAPQLGDSFDILEFTTAGGAFDEFDLPALTTGLAWNVSDLLDSGELKVVADVDLDDDNDVDGLDFLIIQRTNPSLIPVWDELYGMQLVSPLMAVSAAVPEPASAFLFVIGWAVGAFRSRA